MAKVLDGGCCQDAFLPVKVETSLAEAAQDVVEIAEVLGQ